MVYAVEVGVAPVISVSFGFCEAGYSLAYQPIAQQANAQGMTILAASGDSGAAGCDYQGDEPAAANSRSVIFPASLPEVTAMGGTEFNEGSGSYWAATNSSTWDRRCPIFPKWPGMRPAAWVCWQAAAAPAASIPSPRGRPVPESPATAHATFPISPSTPPCMTGTRLYTAGKTSVAGTSCATPSMAGVVALLNQYQIQHGKQTSPGLGNINPQLYRLTKRAQRLPRCRGRRQRRALPDRLHRLH